MGRVLPPLIQLGILHPSGSREVEHKAKLASLWALGRRVRVGSFTRIVSHVSAVTEAAVMGATHGSEDLAGSVGIALSTRCKLRKGGYGT